MIGKAVTGVRGVKDPGTQGRQPDPSVHAPGEYRKSEDGSGWAAMTPSGYYVFLKAADVTEHDDGTISCAAVLAERSHPPIERGGRTVTKTALWRGALVHGEWLEEGA